MPRDGAGNYSLPALGNPAVTNTPITIAWWNGTSTDMATAFTDSLSRSGLGGMLVPFTLVDGTAGAPAFAFQSESTTGFYRPTAGEMDVSVGGTRVARWTSAGFQSTFDNGATWKTPLYAVTSSVSTSSSSGSFNSTSSTWVDVTNLSITFTAGPLGLTFIYFISDNAGTGALVGCNVASTLTSFRLVLDGTQNQIVAFSASGTSGALVPPGVLNTTLTGVAAGSHTVKLQGQLSVGSGSTWFCSLVKMVVIPF